MSALGQKQTFLKALSEGRADAPPTRQAFGCGGKPITGIAGCLRPRRDRPSRRSTKNAEATPAASCTPRSRQHRALSQASALIRLEPSFRWRYLADVRFGSEADIVLSAPCPLYPRKRIFGGGGLRYPRCANRCHFAPQKTGSHSITSSARASSEGGIVRPSAFAGLEVNDQLESSWTVETGRSPGFSPLRMAAGVAAADSGMQFAGASSIAHQTAGRDELRQRE